MKLHPVAYWCIMVILASSLPAQETSSFLPEAVEPGAWRAVSSPRLFVGDSLFDFIDGGAAIYQEYGFREVAAREYADSSGLALDAEIYEMRDPAAAFGIFSFQRGDSAQPVALGDSGVAGSYYVSFWKERYLVMVTARGSGWKSGASLLTFAQQLDQIIPGHDRPPALVRQMEPIVTSGTRLVYVRGYLGLVNQYDFGASDPFGVNEGVVAVGNGITLVALQFGNGQETVEAYDAAGPALQRAPRFSSFSMTRDSVHCIDRDGNHLVLTKHGRHLLGAIAQDLRRAEDALRRISSLL